MKKVYNPKTIEAKWQREWAKVSVFKPKGKNGKFYVLDMFPYPSGDGLHVGHVENFTATDIYARYKRLRGFDVIRPMGWDAFGLPAENFAIKTGVHPSKTTLKSIKNFKRQIKSIGLTYDWEREINTSSPEYYKWTQWMFLFFYKNGLAYKKKANVNWCPSCQTVLANEQVVEGKCDRCGTVVAQKDLEQWFFKITDFIEDTRSKSGKKIAGLLGGLEKIDWPASTKLAQKNWIGRSEGAEAVFYVADTEEEIRVFTTRLDTIYGCTYVIVAPEHPLVAKLLNDKFQISNFKNKEEVQKYIQATKKKTNLERTDLSKEKTGVLLEGIEAIHPFTAKRLPVFVADYVLGGYGTGAVMGVPAHDERDFDFAKKYDLEIENVISPCVTLTGAWAPRAESKTTSRDCVTGIILDSTGKKVIVLRHKKPGTRAFVGGGIDKGESAEEAFIREALEETGYTVKIERQLIASMYGHGFKPHKDANCFDHDIVFIARTTKGAPAVLSSQEQELHEVHFENIENVATLPGLLEHHAYMWKVFMEGERPYTEDGILVNSKEYSGLNSEEAREKMATWLGKEKLGKKKVNYKVRDWLISRQRYWGAPIPIIYCEECGAVPVPEKDLPVKLPTDVDFRPTGESPLVRSKSFHKVYCPKCGAKARRESDTMDTFVCSSWYYLRFADPENKKVFASKKALERYLPVDFYMGGAEHTVLHLLYARFFTKALMKYDYLTFDEPFLKLRHQGIILGENGTKMSKSKGNVINPDQIVEEFGADSLRLYEMFMGPLEDMKAWNTASIIGLRRFLEKVWKLQNKLPTNNRQRTTEKGLESLLHQTVKKVTEDIEGFKFNTAVSSLMILVNALEKEVEIPDSRFKILLVLLSPFAPHIAEELWNKTGEKKSIFLAEWPRWDAKKIAREEVSIAVQVNGKVRAVVQLPVGSTEAEIKKVALADPKVIPYIAGKEIRKVIYIQDKILSLVIS